MNKPNGIIEAKTEGTEAKEKKRTLGMMRTRTNILSYKVTKIHILAIKLFFGCQIMFECQNNDNIHRKMLPQNVFHAFCGFLYKNIMKG